MCSYDDGFVIERITKINMRGVCILPFSKASDAKVLMRMSIDDFLDDP